MLKKLLLVVCICFAGTLQAEELKVTLLEKKVVSYPNGTLGDTEFRILCVNGYKWLQSGVGPTQSTSQMFDNKNRNGYAEPIECQN